MQYSQCIAAIRSKRMAELGLILRMFVEKMDCSQQYIRSAEKRKNMSLETICKIGNALGIDIVKGLKS